MGHLRWTLVDSMDPNGHLGWVILKLDNKNQKLFFCSDHFYVKLNSKKLLLFDRSPKMPRKLVKINFLFIKENIRKDKGNF